MLQRLDTPVLSESRSHRLNVLALLWLALVSVAAAGEPLPAEPFRLREMDLHLHSGMERPVPLAKWVDLAVADGRRVIVLLDHLELYRKNPQEYEQWRSERGFEARYPLGPEGHRALFRDFDAVAARTDALIFKGWEVGETELDSGLELAPLRMADVIGWHIGPNHGGAPPDGQTLLRRARQLLQLQRELPIPMILFHPFPMRIENLYRAAKQQGRKTSSIGVEELRFFHRREQQELIELLRGSSIYVEIGRDTEQYFDNPAVREALIADVEPLARGEVQFTVSTDNHHLRAAAKPFDPERYCTPLGVNEQNANGLVRELLARRVRAALPEAARRPAGDAAPPATIP